MKFRRVVLGTTGAGKSTVLSDEVARRNSVFTTLPGFGATLLWSTAARCQVGGSSAFKDPTLEASFVPGPGESRLMFVTFPPDAGMLRAEFDGAAFGEEVGRLLPGLAETFEPNAPGMHTTNSIDYDVVLDGEITLELDDGQEVVLRKHEIAVQQGNRHAWRNKTDKPATMLFVLIGTPRAA